MSGLLLDFVHAQYKIHASTDDINNSDDLNDGDVEQPHLKIQTDHCGNLVNHNQLTDYWYRGATLSKMNFYDFSRCITLEIKPKLKDSVSVNTCLTHVKHQLLDDHPLVQTHHLVQHTNEERREVGKQLVPRVVGSNIPRQNTG